MAFIDSNSELRRVWFVSFAKRNDGDDMEAKSCRSLYEAKGLRFSKYAAVLLMMARRAG